MGREVVKMAPEDETLQLVVPSLLLQDRRCRRIRRCLRNRRDCLCNAGRSAQWLERRCAG